jgi:hypothetical protein
MARNQQTTLVLASLLQFSDMRTQQATLLPQLYNLSEQRHEPSEM